MAISEKPTKESVKRLVKRFRSEVYTQLSVSEMGGQTCDLTRYEYEGEHRFLLSHDSLHGGKERGVAINKGDPNYQWAWALYEVDKLLENWDQRNPQQILEAVTTAMNAPNAPASDSQAMGIFGLIKNALNALLKLSSKILSFFEPPSQAERAQSSFDELKTAVEDFAQTKPPTPQ